jgi:hypothetical protein
MYDLTGQAYVMFESEKSNDVRIGDKKEFNLVPSQFKSGDESASHILKVEELPCRNFCLALLVLVLYFLPACRT